MSAGNEPIDNYEVVNFIAGSGSSQVLEVIEPGTHRHLAMKLLNDKHPDFKENKSVLKAEAAVCKALDHPNIVHYEGFTNGREHTYLLMEYFRAPTLKVQLKLDPNGVHLRMKKLLEGFCSALQHLHERGFVHRDIKPENVLMNKVGEVRLIDFSLATRPKGGIAKLLGGRQSSIQGTRTYIAPETIRKQSPVFQTDFYSFGIMLFELLTGKTPFQAPTPNELLQKHVSAQPPNPSEFNPNVSPEMDRLVIKLLSKKPDQRGKDVAEIAAELRRIRYFKEEISEVSSTVADEKPADLLDQLSGGKLDSRLDAQRSELVRQNPDLAVKLAEQQQSRQAATAAKKAHIEDLKSRAAAGKAKSTGTPEAQRASPQPQPPPQQPNMPFPFPMPAGYPMYPPGYGGQPMMPYPQQGMVAPPGYPGMPATYPPGMTPPSAASTPIPFAGMVPSGGPVGTSPPQSLPTTQPVTPVSPPVAKSAVPVNPGPSKPTAPPPPSGSQPTMPPAPSPELTAMLKSGKSAETPAKNAPNSKDKPATEENLEFMTELPDIL